MTTRQVIENVATLTSRDAQKESRVLIAAINRALDEVGRRFPLCCRERICQVNPKPVYALSARVSVFFERPYRISADAIGAFSLSVYGDGEVRILLDGEVLESYAVTPQTPLTLTTAVSALKSGAESGNIEVIVTANTQLMIESMAFFTKAPERLMPYGRYAVYPASEFSHRFLRFTGKCYQNERLLGKGAVRFDGDRVLIPYAADGTYEIEYEALYDSVQDDDREVLMQGDLLAAVILLAAYYAALEDENPNADAFLSRYGQAISLVGAFGDEKVVDVYGW